MHLPARNTAPELQAPTSNGLFTGYDVETGERQACHLDSKGARTALDSLTIPSAQQMVTNV